MTQFEAELVEAIEEMTAQLKRIADAMEQASKEREAWVGSAEDDS